jgi:hypothetical protein
MGAEAFWIPAVIAGLSAAGQGVNQMQAQKRQQNAQVQSIANQGAIRGNANALVKNLTDQIAKNSPQKDAAKETGDFVNTLRRNQAGKDQDTNFGAPTSALPPAAGASSRYRNDSANASTENQKFGTTMADEVGKIDAAVRQRQNEGLAQQTLGTGLNQLGAQSYTQNFVDQLRAQAAGQANPWVTMGFGLMGAGAKAFSQDPTMFSKDGTPSGDIYGTGGFGGNMPTGLPGSTSNIPQVNPWFDTMAESH